jgi:hypothetical protein
MLSAFISPAAILPEVMALALILLVVTEFAAN